MNQRIMPFESRSNDCTSLWFQADTGNSHTVRVTIFTCSQNSLWTTCWSRSSASIRCSQYTKALVLSLSLYFCTAESSHSSGNQPREIARPEAASAFRVTSPTVQFKSRCINNAVRFFHGFHWFPIAKARDRGNTHAHNQRERERERVQ